MFVIIVLIIFIVEGWFGSPFSLLWFFWETLVRYL